MNQPIDPGVNQEDSSNDQYQADFNQQQQQQQYNPQFGPMYRPDPSVMTVKQWLLTMLVMIIPIVNIVMLFVWAFSSTGNANRKNWAVASLVWVAIVIVLYILLIIVFGALFASAVSSGSYSY